MTRPSFKDVDAFEEMLRFAEEASHYIHDTVFTVVDIIGEEEIAKSQAIADRVGIKLRVREYIDEE